MTTAIEDLIKLIEDDLRDRNGFSEVFDDVNPTTLEEIHRAWAVIIEGWGCKWGYR